MVEVGVEQRQVDDAIEYTSDFPFTLKKIAAELVKNGVDVYQWLERCEYGFPDSPMICFNGDENEGRRASLVVCDYGLPIFTLNRTWHYVGKEGNEPVNLHWEMLFPTTLPRSVDVPD